MKLGDYLLHLVLQEKLENGFIIRYQGVSYEFNSFDEFLKEDFDHYLSNIYVDKCNLYGKVSLL